MMINQSHFKVPLPQSPPPNFQNVHVGVSAGEKDWRTGSNEVPTLPLQPTDSYRLLLGCLLSQGG